jgi:hypothetical protein
MAPIRLVSGQLTRSGDVHSAAPHASSTRESIDELRDASYYTSSTWVADGRKEMILSGGQIWEKTNVVSLERLRELAMAPISPLARSGDVCSTPDASSTRDLIDEVRDASSYPSPINSRTASTHSRTGFLHSPPAGPPISWPQALDWKARKAASLEENMAADALAPEVVPQRIRERQTEGSVSERLHLQ